MPACAQDPADADAESAVQQLFGVGLQSRLVCEESGEAIEEGSTVYELKWAPSFSLPSISPKFYFGELHSLYEAQISYGNVTHCTKLRPPMADLTH